MKNRPHAPVPPALLAERLAVYERTEARWGMDDPPATWWGELVRELRPENPDRRRGPVMRQWWEHPEFFSPYPDQVALDRAFNQFDRSVIANLSDLEYQMFTERLANDPDKPWLEENPTKGMRRQTAYTNVKNAGYRANASWLSDRGRAWYRLTEDERMRLLRMIGTRREARQRAQRKVGTDHGPRTV